MSDEIRPITPISRIEPLTPVSAVRNTDPGLYQIFAIQLARFFETLQQPSPLPPSPFFPGAIMLPQPLRLRSQPMKRKKSKVRKVEAVFQTALGR